MGARTSFSIDVLEASQTSSAVPTGRAIVVGTAGEGPGNTPTLIRGMAEYRAVFGQRAGGADMHDALQQAFACGLAEAWVVRGVGSSAASASGVIDDLTVTARYPGSAANAWVATLALPSGQKPVFTLAGPGVSERFTAATGAELFAAINANSSKVRVTGAVGDAGTVTLSGGTASDGSVTAAGMLATTLGLGSGMCVLAPGRSTSATWQAIAEHCDATGRIGLLTLPAGSTKDSALTANGTVAGYAGADRCTILWPRLVLDDGTAAELAGVAAGRRAAAHSAYGPQRSLITVDSGAIPIGTPEYEILDADWAELDAAGVSVARTVAGRTAFYSWKLVRGLGGNTNLDGVQHADTVNAVQAACDALSESFRGENLDGRGLAIAQLAGAVEGMLSLRAAAGALYAWVVDGVAVDPGYVVQAGPSVNTPEDIAAGNITIKVGLRLASLAEFTFFSISVADAATALV
jgi:hypothetical protein